MASIEEQLQQLEEALLEPATRTDAFALSSLLAEDFCEFGSSGRIFNRQQIVDALQTECPVQYSLTDFRARLVAQDVALVTYQATLAGRLEPNAGASLRSSLWVRRDGRWTMLFHQGTIISSPH